MKESTVLRLNNNHICSCGNQCSSLGPHLQWCLWLQFGLQVCDLLFHLCFDYLISILEAFSVVTSPSILA